MIRAPIPKMPRILNRLEPITLPIATSLRPRMLDTSDATTSGKPVPAETIVRPMTRSDKPSSRASPTAPVTVA